MAHTSGEAISAADIDRTFSRIQNGVYQYPAGLAVALTSQIGVEQLSAELQNILITLIGNYGGLGSYDVDHTDISSMAEGASTIVLLGKDAASGIREVFAIDAITQVLTATTPVVVDSIPTIKRDYPDMIKCGDYVWAIGASGADTNMVTKIHVDTLAATGFEATADTAAVVTAVATDNSYIYAFVKEGTYMYPNTFVKMAQNGSRVGLIYSGLATTGAVSVCVSSNGYLYASFDDATVKQVRKYDTSPVNGLQKTFSVAAGDFLDTPTFVCPVDEYVYVLNGLYLHRISCTADTSTLVHTYAFAPDRLYYDGVVLWVAAGDKLYKCDKLGNIIQTLTPVTGQDIQAIRKTFAFLFTTYVDEASTDDITKMYPGLPVI